MYKASEDDKFLAKHIVREEYERRGLSISDRALIERVDDALNTLYSIGGGYDEDTIRQIMAALIDKSCW